MALVLVVDGKVQIPEDIRAEFGFMARDPLRFTLEGQHIVITRVKPFPAEMPTSGRMARVVKLRPPSVQAIQEAAERSSDSSAYRPL